MPSVNISAYVRNDDWKLYLQNKEELNQIARGAMEKTLQKLRRGVKIEKSISGH